MKLVAQNTDFRASRASATVKNRIKMCGSPAVPNISASPSEIAETGSLTSAPGRMIALCFGDTSTALANSASTLKPNANSTMKAMKLAPPSSSAALMICTQVVASMPPNMT